MRFIELTVGYVRDDDDVDYDGLDIDLPEDYDPDWLPTLFAVDKIVRVCPTAGRYTSVIIADDPVGYRVKESYEEVKEMIMPTREIPEPPAWFQYISTSTK